MRHKYLFILSPPYSGSTALWRVLQSSGQVAALPDEGQKLPELREMMRDDPWNAQRSFDWPLIKRVWHDYWDLERPVLLEKSPPHLCRFREIDKHFSPAWYLLLMRDPLATCEALNRRNGWDWDTAARRWVEWLDLHLACREALQRTQVVYYEEMVSERAATFARLARWLPELQKVDPASSVSAHAIDGEQQRPLTDLNPLKLGRVDDRARDRILTVLHGAAPLLCRTPYGEQYL